MSVSLLQKSFNNLKLVLCFLRKHYKEIYRHYRNVIIEYLFYSCNKTRITSSLFYKAFRINCRFMIDKLLQLNFSLQPMRLLRFTGYTLENRHFKLFETILERHTRFLYLLSCDPWTHDGWYNVDYLQDGIVKEVCKYDLVNVLKMFLRLKIWNAVNKDFIRQSCSRGCIDIIKYLLQDEILFYDPKINMFISTRMFIKEHLELYVRVAMKTYQVEMVKILLDVYDKKTIEDWVLVEGSFKLCYFTFMDTNSKKQEIIKLFKDKLQ